MREGCILCNFLILIKGWKKYHPGLMPGPGQNLETTDPCQSSPSPQVVQESSWAPGGQGTVCVPPALAPIHTESGTLGTLTIYQKKDVSTV